MAEILEQEDFTIGPQPGSNFNATILIYVPNSEIVIFIIYTDKFYKDMKEIIDNFDTVSIQKIVIMLYIPFDFVHSLSGALSILFMQ